MPRAISSSVVFVLPGFASRYAERPAAVPSLERLAAYSTRGMLTSAKFPALETWQVELLDALRLEDPRHYPSAPLTWLGARGEREPGTWFHADPVRMEVSTRGLTLQQSRAWSAADLALLAAALREYLEIAQLQWQVTAGRAFIAWPAALDVETTSVQHALRASLRDALPRGGHGAEVRRVMTELQMLIHDKMPHANAIWLWGAGRMHDAQSDEIARPLPSLWTNDAYARGIYLSQRAAQHCASLPDNFNAALVEDASRSLFVIRDLEASALERLWFAPALQALDARQIDAVEIYLDGYSFAAIRSLWRRMFARPQPMMQTLVASQ